MKIGVLGSGDVGRTLGRAFIALGHDVKLGSREATNEKAKAWAKKAGAKASTGTFADAAAFGEMLVIATLGNAAEAAIRSAGPDKFAGKVVIDTTNPLDQTPTGPKLSVGHTDSAGERVQRAAPGAYVVKAFNTVGAAHMFKPSFPGGPPDMFICGNDAGAKQKVSSILRDFGWGVIDLGGIESSRYLEPLCLVWVLHGAIGKSWSHAFKMLHK